jgi:hypothetical protein
MFRKGRKDEDEKPLGLTGNFGTSAVEEKYKTARNSTSRPTTSLASTRHLNDFKMLLQYILSLRFRVPLPRNLIARVGLFGLFGKYSHVRLLADDLGLFDDAIAAFIPSKHTKSPSQSPPQRNDSPLPQTTQQLLTFQHQKPHSQQQDATSSASDQFPTEGKDNHNKYAPPSHHLGLLDHQALFALDGFGVIHEPHTRHVLKHSSELCRLLPPPNLNRADSKSSASHGGEKEGKAKATVGLRVIGDDKDHALRIDMTQLRCARLLRGFDALLIFCFVCFFALFALVDCFFFL